jgi:hypothetical protein
MIDAALAGLLSAIYYACYYGILDTAAYQMECGVAALRAADLAIAIRSPLEGVRSWCPSVCGLGFMLHGTWHQMSDISSLQQLYIVYLNTKQALCSVSISMMYDAHVRLGLG